LNQVEQRGSHRTRNRVLKNNEALAHATEKPTDDLETRDQGFTRPKVLILVPFRNSALTWLNLLTTLSLASTVENKARFDSEFGLPKGTTDKLAEPDAATKYPADHIATFAGNIDDSFRVGLKVTRKTLKCFAEFYQSDIILASPLGLRMSIEKEKDSDFLSSLEVVVVDQADVLTMQNWEHVQVSPSPHLFQR
jgi:U3 small nucleolar RNA-associated protein 25